MHCTYLDILLYILRTPYVSGRCSGLPACLPACVSTLEPPLPRMAVRRAAPSNSQRVHTTKSPAGVSHITPRQRRPQAQKYGAGSQVLRSAPGVTLHREHSTGRHGVTRGSVPGTTALRRTTRTDSAAAIAAAPGEQSRRRKRSHTVGVFASVAGGAVSGVCLPTGDAGYYLRGWPGGYLRGHGDSLAL